MVFVTYGKGGKVIRHKTILSARVAAQKKAKKLPAGQVAFIDKFIEKDKGLRNVEVVVSPKRLKARKLVSPRKSTPRRTPKRRR